MNYETLFFGIVSVKKYAKVEMLLAYIMEGSHSGLVRHLGKVVRCYNLRGSESLTLRLIQNTMWYVYICELQNYIF